MSIAKCECYQNIINEWNGIEKNSHKGMEMNEYSLILILFSLT